MLDSQNVDERAFGREYLAEGIAGADAETVLALVLDGLATHPEEAPATLRAFGRYLARTGVILESGDERLWNALSQSELSAEEFAGILDRFQLGSLALEVRDSLVRRLVSLLSKPTAPYGSCQDKLSAILQHLFIPALFRDLADDRPGGDILGDLIQNPQIATDLRVWALTMWMTKRNGHPSWSPDRISRVDAIIDLNLRVQALLNFFQITADRNATYPLDEPLLDALLARSASAEDNLISRQATEIVITHIARQAIVGIPSEVAYQRIVDLILSPELDFRARNRLLRYTLPTQQGINVTQMRNRGVVVRPPGTTASLDIILASYYLGVPPRPEEITRISRLVQDMIARIPRPQSRHDLAILRATDYSYYTYLHYALQSAVRFRVAALGSVASVDFYVLASTPSHINSIQRMSNELPYLAAFFQDDTSAWRRVLCDSGAPLQVRRLFFALLERQGYTELDALARGSLLADPEYCVSAAQWLVLHAGWPALFEAIAENPSPNQVKLAGILEEDLGRHVDDIYRLTTLPSVRAVPRLHEELRFLLRVWCFPHVLQRRSVGEGYTHFASRLDNALTTIMHAPQARANPLTAIEMCLANAAPEDQEDLKQFFTSRDFTFPMMNYLTKRSLRSLPSNLLVALLRNNASPQADGSQRTREIVREWLLLEEPAVAIEALRCLNSVPALGSLKDETIRNRLFLFGRTLGTDERVSLVSRLWLAHRTGEGWTDFLRNAHRDPAMPAELLQAVSDPRGVALVWESSEPALRGDTAFRRRLIASGIAALENAPARWLLARNTQAALLDLAGDEPAAEAIRHMIANVPRPDPKPDSPPTIARANEILELVCNPDGGDRDKLAEQRELAAHPSVPEIDAFPLVRLLANGSLSAACRQEVHRILGRVWDHGAYQYLGSVLDRQKSEEERASAVRGLSSIKPHLLGGSLQIRRVIFLFLEVCRHHAEDPVINNAFRMFLRRCGVLSEPGEESRSTSLGENELARIHSWLKLEESGELTNFWESSDNTTEISVIDARVLLGSFCAWGFHQAGEVSDYCQKIDNLPLPASERIEALQKLAQDIKFGGLPLVAQRLVHMGWGEDTSDFREVARGIVSQAIKSNYYASENLCIAALHEPRIPDRLRFSAFLRLGNRYRLGGDLPTLEIASFLLDGKLTDAQRARGFAVLSETQLRLKATPEQRERMLGLIGDRGRSIELRAALIRSVRKIDVMEPDGPRPVHWEAGEAVEEVPDTNLDDAQASLWAILGNERLPNNLRAVALSELLRSYNVPSRAHLHNLLREGGTPEDARWLFRQLRAANRLADHSWRSQIISHAYRTGIGELRRTADALPHLPPGMALYVADLVKAYPRLGPAIEHAFSLRRGAVATAAAIGTWMQFLSQVKGDSVPGNIMDLFQIPEDRQIDDPTLLAESWLNWKNIERMTNVPDEGQFFLDTTLSFAERAARVEEFLYRQAATLLLPQHDEAPQEDHLPRVAAALRKVSHRTPAPLVLSGHYRTTHAAGLPLLGEAVTAWAEGSWADFRYAPARNPTLAALPPETVAAWRSRLGFAVPQIHANQTFVAAAGAIADTIWQVSPMLDPQRFPEWATLRELRSVSSPDADRIAIEIGKLEAKAVAAGQTVAQGTTRENADRLREEARTLRFLANLARFAFLNPDALAVNELRALGEHGVPLPDGTVQRAVSIRRAFDRLKGQARDFLQTDALQKVFAATERLINQLPEFPERAELVVEERDDFPTLIEIGARPYGSGSCQNYQSTGPHNKALLAYLCDGDKKVIVAREARTLVPDAPPDLRARAILRLGRTPENDPALLLEPIYASGGRGDQLRAEIEQLARRKAAALRAVLLRAGSGETTATIQIAPSRNRVQYEDSGGGLRSEADGYSLTLPVLADDRAE